MQTEVCILHVDVARLCAFYCPWPKALEQVCWPLISSKQSSLDNCEGSCTTIIARICPAYHRDIGWGIALVCRLHYSDSDTKHSMLGCYEGAVVVYGRLKRLPYYNETFLKEISLRRSLLPSTWAYQKTVNMLTTIMVDHAIKVIVNVIYLRLVSWA